MRVITFSGEEGLQFLVRLFQYVPGEMLDGKTLTPNLCFEVGQLAGRLDKALKVCHCVIFLHPAVVIAPYSYITRKENHTVKFRIDMAKIIQNQFNVYVTKFLLIFTL
jgi:Ser/Thr protein kinase RdoA (MazF antagonist)